MNLLENWYCSTSFWRWITRERLLPWLLGQADLGNHLLEIGSGPGAATAELRKRVPHVISLEYDHESAARLAQKNGKGAGVVQGDAAALPFADRIFSSAVAVLVLHHLRSCELQDRTFAEVHRVLQPGGHFFAFEIPDGWFHRVIHTNSTFVPVQPASLAARLTIAGFAGVTLDHRSGGFRFRASREN
ncbi:MAG TPA: methyltransferase domain-containing protein [Candidatus Acidoferrum sp.]|nr:methyltransferase domain-containing protein [Candidatus Acidoferrum sp.]